MNQGATTTRRSFTKPSAVALVAFVLSLLFVLARLVIAADGDTSKFVVAGNIHTDAALVPTHLHVFPTSGYDGQFYWRLAVDPTDLHTTRSNGVQFDEPLRASRIAYPTLAWVLAAGQADLVAGSLVAVNVLAFTALAWFGALFARRHARSVWFGLFASSATGLIMSLARDLNEVVMVAAVVGGIVALHDKRWLLASGAWSLAVLCHEQSLYVVGAYGATRLYAIVRRRSRPQLIDLAAVLPVVAFAVWQAVAAIQTGEAPVLGSGSASIGVPFDGLVTAISEWARGDIDRQELLVIPQLLLAAALVTWAVRARRDVEADDRWLLSALAIGVVLTVCLSYNVWVGPAELRQMVMVPTLAGVVLVASRRRLPLWLPAAAALVWLATAGLRVVAI